MTHDVAPYDVVAGVPARRLRRRFDGETAAALGRIRWWDWPHELLRERDRGFFAQSRDSAKNTIRSEQDRNEHHLQKARIDRFELLDGQWVFPAADLDREGGPVQAVDEPVLKSPWEAVPSGEASL